MSQVRNSIYTFSHFFRLSRSTALSANGNGNQINYGCAGILIGWYIHTRSPEKETENVRGNVAAANQKELYCEWGWRGLFGFNKLVNDSYVCFVWQDGNSLRISSMINHLVRHLFGTGGLNIQVFKWAHECIRACSCERSRLCASMPFPWNSKSL